MLCFELNLDFGQTTTETSFFKIFVSSQVCTQFQIPLPNIVATPFQPLFATGAFVALQLHISPKLKIISQIIIFIFRYIILLFSEVCFSGKVWAKLFSFCVLRRGYKKSGSRISSV